MCILDKLLILIAGSFSLASFGTHWDASTRCFPQRPTTSRHGIRAFNPALLVITPPSTCSFTNWSSNKRTPNGKLSSYEMGVVHQARDGEIDRDRLGCDIWCRHAIKGQLWISCGEFLWISHSPNVARMMNRSDPILDRKIEYSNEIIRMTLPFHFSFFYTF